MAEQFWVFDGNFLLWRAHYARFQPLSIPCPECPWLKGDTFCHWCEGSGREVTKAIFTVTTQLIRLCREKQPSYMAFAFDGPRSALHRRKLYPPYKQQRDDHTTPVEFRTQMIRLKQILKALGVAVVTAAGHEADDVIASLVTQYTSDAVHAVVVTRDNDLEQLLVDERVTLYDPQIDRIRTGVEVAMERGVPIRLLRDLKALTGDSGDNVPGVPGFGPKTSATLLRQYGSVHELLKMVGALKPRLQNALQPMTEQVRLNLELVTLKKNLTLETSVDHLTHHELNFERARPLFRLLGFRRWAADPVVGGTARSTL